MGLMLHRHPREVEVLRQVYLVEQAVQSAVSDNTGEKDQPSFLGRVVRLLRDRKELHVS